MSFTYTAAGEIPAEVEVKAILENPGIWQKEITLVDKTTKTGRFTIDFPLDIDEINELFDTIDKEIKITSSKRQVTIVASVGSGSEVFTHRLPIILGKTLIEVDSNLKLTQADTTGEFDYSVHLKENSLFDTETLKPPPPVIPPPPPTPPPPPPPKTVRPGELLFSKLTDKMDVTFHYTFKSDKPVMGLTEEVAINAILENPKVWSKTFVLVPPTTKSGSFSISFPLDINHFTETLEAIRSETGVPAELYNLTIIADVHTVAQTDFGPIDKVFSQTMSTTLGGGTLKWSEELVSSKPGSIETTKMIPNPNRYLGLSLSGVKILSAVMLGIFALLFAYLAWLNSKFKPVGVSPIEKEVRLARKKYKELMAEATSQTPIDGEKIISLDSMEDLSKVADELGKPIIHQAPSALEESHAYFVFDGSTRYQYLLTTKSKEPANDGGRTE